MAQDEGFFLTWSGLDEGGLIRLRSQGDGPLPPILAVLPDGTERVATSTSGRFDPPLPLGTQVFVGGMLVDEVRPPPVVRSLLYRHRSHNLIERTEIRAALRGAHTIDSTWVGLLPSVGLVSSRIIVTARAD